MDNANSQLEWCDKLIRQTFCSFEKTMEHLRYCGEMPQDNKAYQQYLEDMRRGKTLLQLQAVQREITPEIRQSWSVRTFSPVMTPAGMFDEVVCNISYHFHKHGSKYYSITRMTEEARRFFAANRGSAAENALGLLKFPDGSIYEKDGRIITFVS